MITRLDISNLRSFAGQHQLPLAPVTLVYGPNSAGKSTLMQSLGVLQQTFAAAQRSRTGASTLEFRGDLVDLGGFATAVHAHDITNHLGLGAGISDDAGPDFYVGVTFTGQPESDLARQVSATLGLGGHMMRFDVPTTTDGTAFTLGDDGQRTFEALIDEGTGPADNPSVRRAIVEALSDRGPVGPAGAPFQAGVSLPLVPALPEPGAWLKGYQSQDLQLAQWWVDNIYDRVDRFRTMLDELSYLGPMRSAPTRFQTLSSAHAVSQVTGGYTTRLLAQNEVDGSGSPLQDDVNDWLGRMDVGYRLAVEPVRTHDDLHIGDLVTTALIDPRNDIAVTPQDVGYGVSQLLPIIVQLLASRRSTICIEQPEVHIHPRLQTELGDLLIESTRRGGRRNQVIVETHSEHLLLRFMRRIRNGEFDPADLSVIYVDRDFDGWAHPRRMVIDDQGDFVGSWPGGFFDERSSELLRVMRGPTVLLVLSVEAIDELNAPRPNREENLRRFLEFVREFGVHVYATREDRRQIGQRILADDSGMGAPLRKLWDEILGAARRHKTYGEPPPPSSLSELRGDPDGWLTRWSGFADLVLLDTPSYQVFTNRQVDDRSPGDIWFRTGRLTVAQARFWADAPPVQNGPDGFQILPGMRRDDIADPLLGAYPEHVSVVSIIDPYLARGAATREMECRVKGRHKVGELEWLLARLAAQARVPLTVAIFSPAPTDLNPRQRRAVRQYVGLYDPEGNTRMTHELIAEQYDTILRRLAESTPPTVFESVRLIDAAPPGTSLSSTEPREDEHSRWLLLHDHVAIAVDKGFDVLDRDPISRPSDVHFHTVRSSLYEAKLEQMDRMGNRNPGTLWTWRGTHYHRDALNAIQASAPRTAA